MIDGRWIGSVDKNLQSAQKKVLFPIGARTEQRFNSHTLPNVGRATLYDSYGIL